MTDGPDETRDDDLAKVRQGLINDPGRYTAIFREANRRAIFSHLTTLLNYARDEEDPVCGIAYVAFTEKGRCWWTFAGQTDPVRMLGLIECLKIVLTNIFNLREPKRFNYLKDESMGDTIVFGEEGEPEIKCQGTDRVEADREKAENGHRLLHELVLVARDFYGEEFDADIGPALACLDDYAVGRLAALDPKVFYKDDGGGP